MLVGPLFLHWSLVFTFILFSCVTPPPPPFSCFYHFPHFNLENLHCTYLSFFTECLVSKKAFKSLVSKKAFFLLSFASFLFRGFSVDRSFFLYRISISLYGNCQPVNRLTGLLSSCAFKNLDGTSGNRTRDLSARSR